MNSIEYVWHIDIINVGVCTISNSNSIMNSAIINQTFAIKNERNGLIQLWPKVEIPVGLTIVLMLQAEHTFR